jgi:signal transduction histidine kinase
MRILRLLIAALAACPAAQAAPTESGRPRSMLMLDSTNVRSPFYYETFSKSRGTASGTGSPVTVYAEILDLTRFNGPAYEEGLRHDFQINDGDKPIGIVVAAGSATHDRVLHWRSELWPATPVVFGFVTEPTLARLTLLPGVTAGVVKLRLADTMKAARAVVPDLQRIAFVGGPLERHTVYRHWKNEIPGATMGLQIIDLRGLRIPELHQGVAAPPDRSAILDTGVYLDGDGTGYVPAEAPTVIANPANRPIAGTAETEPGRGSIGRLPITPSLVGGSAVKTTIRILDGENAESVPVSLSDITKPMFDWRHMQHWGVGEPQLPPGSDVRFGDPAGWKRSTSQISAISFAILMQAAIIIWLLFERRYRRRAEATVRDTVSELTNVNRLAAAGELSASIAHEISQPLTGIVTRAGAARRWLARDNLDIEKVRAALAQIESAAMHTSQIVHNMRAIFKRDTHDRAEVDINRTVLTVLELARHEMQKHKIELRTQLDERLPRINGNEVQLQQVILNLLMNAVEAMHFAQPRVLHIRSCLSRPGVVNVSIEDTGIGIGPSDSHQIFKPLFTTKAKGMGIGLSICRSIIEGHGGRIWASQSSGKGSIFQFELPAAFDKGSGAGRTAAMDLCVTGAPP